MAAVRLFLILATGIGFFLLATPVQWWIARYRPSVAHRIPLVFCRSLLALTRVRLVVEGTWPCDRPVLVAANHVSWIDVPALGSLAPFCFLAKSEVARWPLISSFAAVQGTVFVDRRRRRSIPPANRAMSERLLEGRPVLLFPEGTTVARPPGRFHSSHFAAARTMLAMAPEIPSVWIQPVAVTYSRGDAAWVGDEALLPHLWRVLRRPPLTCRVRFCPPLTYAREHDRKALAAAARASVAAALNGEPITSPIGRSCGPSPATCAEGGQAPC